MTTNADRDPASVGTCHRASKWAIKLLVFDSLVRYDEDLQIVPGVAVPTVSPDAKSYTFRLRKGVEFSDGTPLEAATAVGSLERAAGAKGIWAARLADVQGYQTPDPRTIVIRLKRPNAAFLDGLAHIALMSPRSFSTARTKPVGSGPFTFVSRTPNSKIVLESNERYPRRRRWRASGSSRWRRSASRSTPG
jgi:peptide/nickel transport system substrate-binding protein